MAEETHHGLVGPIALEDIVAFLRGTVAFDDALLVHARHGILRTERRGEILEDPLGATGQPRHLLLLLEVPVEEIDHVALGPITVLGHADLAAGLFVSLALLGRSFADSDLFDQLLGLFGEAAGMTITTPLGMEEMLGVLQGLLGGGGVLGIATGIPASPDARGIDVDDVLAEIAAANRRRTQRVKLMGKVVQFLHEGADTFLVLRFEVARPVVFVAEAPHDDGRMVAMLLDEGLEHVATLLLVTVTADATAAPRNLFPDQEAEFIAKFQD